MLLGWQCVREHNKNTNPTTTVGRGVGVARRFISNGVAASRGGLCKINTRCRRRRRRLRCRHCSLARGVCRLDPVRRRRWNPRPGERTKTYPISTNLATSECEFSDVYHIYVSIIVYNFTPRLRGLYVHYTY